MWEEALDEINSPAFRASLSVVSSTDAFFKAVAQQPAVLDAQRFMLESGEAREGVLGRIYDLVSEETEPGFLNPNDKPLAVLLWLTAFVAPDYTEMAAKWADRAPRCWYAKDLAHRVLNPPPSTTRDYKFGGKPDETRAGEMWPGNIKFAMRPLTETHLKFFNVDLRQEPSTLVFTQQKPEQSFFDSSEEIP